MKKIFSAVEQAFIDKSGVKEMTTTTPYIITESVPQMGLLMALRFIEWVAQNPNGVISLPTGKTPQYFIQYTHEILDNWDSQRIQEVLKKHGLGSIAKPQLSGLQFVQMDEFYPIAPTQHNSFYNYVNEVYIKGFGLDPDKALLINTDEIPLYEGKSYREVFPDYKIDLDLRYRTPKTSLEKIQQQSIFLIDDWCARYEDKIHEKGGIGFFMSPIGSDGRVAFNVSGSNRYSNTQLTKTNYATQADAASDLGGIEVSKNRLVITIGLETIIYNKDVVSLIYAAGEANAFIVKDALESPKMTLYPATALQGLANTRFYLTGGSACRLEDSINRYYNTGEWNFEKTVRAVIGLCKKLNKYAHRLTIDDLHNDPRCSMIPNLSTDTVKDVIAATEDKLSKGSIPPRNEVIYNTGPHHDDIMLGILPLCNRQTRDASNEVHFAVMTSGFNSVTNGFVRENLEYTMDFIEKGEIQMLNYSDFFVSGYKFKYDKDIYHYLDNVARKNAEEMRRGFSHRIVRDIVVIWGVKNTEELKRVIREQIEVLRNSYDGEKNTIEIQRLKGMIREFEEELVWAYTGTQVKNVHHLRLGFYQASLFSQAPDYQRDIMPILNQLREIKPTTISVVIDPEGSGPDTHFKVLQAVAGAVTEWNKEADLSNLKIIGYRNVWFKFNPAEATTYIPVSLNAMAVIEKSFASSYLTQVKAEYPSPDFDGSFSELAESIWVKQLKDIQLVLGKNYFYEHENPLIRSTHGLIFTKEMNVGQFCEFAESMRKKAQSAL
ncbi:MAG: hypothetical protein MJZ90_02995 [Bacteroidales bacterium]|nr:hypothetical protein [Bacteroidales bacterium]